jgi:2-C-methyl-D-erythritol 4-phosphate cytidylyltransferase
MIGCILLAGGKGNRFGAKKQFLEINGLKIFEYSLKTIEWVEEIDFVVVVLPKEDLDIEIKSSKKIIKVEGGSERQFSVYNGLRAIADCDIVAIHDSARPFATVNMFRDGIKNVKAGWDGSITAYRSPDTIKRVINNKIVETLNRDEIYIVQTPQVFDFKKLLKAHEYALENNILATDDSALMEKLGYRITVNEGSFFNFKITYLKDLEMVECFIKGKKVKG